MPSSRWQISATAGAFSLVTAKPGATARARSMNRRTASYWGSAAASSAAPKPGCRGSGIESDGTRQVVSPAMPSASRLVARIRRSGQARNNPSARAAQAATRCSQLSSTSSSARVWRYSWSVCIDRAAGLLADAERRRHHLRDQRRVGQRRQLDEPGAVAVRLQHVGRDLQREAGLAGPARPDERQQATSPRAAA